jgi:hypothetical protein
MRTLRFAAGKFRILRLRMSAVMACPFVRSDKEAR